MQILDGKLVAAKTREQLRKELEEINAIDKVGLAVILVGDDPASKVYVRNKINACAEVGIKSTLVALPGDTSEEELYAAIDKLNKDDSVHGIILQLPIPKHLDEYKFVNAIDESKDVDGNGYEQKGKLWVGKPEFIPCTPSGVMRILDFYNIPLEGKNAVVVGRSNLVGKPLAQLLMNRNCTVTICHSRTKDLDKVCASADVLCVAIGKAKFVTKNMVKDGAVVVDVGMDRDENGKLCGDVDFEDVKEKCSYITPVPGGVGPMTVTMLMDNTVKAYKNR